MNTRIDRALAAALLAYNTGIPEHIAATTTLDDHFGPGLEIMLRSHAAGYNDCVYFMSHDDPQSSIEGNWQEQLRGDGYSISKLDTHLPGVHVLACWTCGGYIDSAALFLFGLRLPMLKYSMGADVSYSLGV